MKINLKSLLGAFGAVGLALVPALLFAADPVAAPAAAAAAPAAPAMVVDKADTTWR